MHEEDGRLVGPGRGFFGRDPSDLIGTADEPLRMIRRMEEGLRMKSLLLATLCATACTYVYEDAAQDEPAPPTPIVDPECGKCILEWERQHVGIDPESGVEQWCALNHRTGGKCCPYLGDRECPDGYYHTWRVPCVQPMLLEDGRHACFDADAFNMSRRLGRALCVYDEDTLCFPPRDPYQEP